MAAPMPRHAAGNLARTRARALWLGAAAALLMLLPQPGSVARAQAEAVVRGNPEATQGGVRRTRFPVPPAQLHPVNATGLYANEVLGRIYETLAETDVARLEFIPLLAEDWDISEDKLTYTFRIDPAARWADGRPVTAGDVAFSYEVLFHEALKTRGKWQAYYSNVAEAEVVNQHTVRFRVKEDHFRNLVNLASLRIVPKHGFTGEDPNETPLAKEPMGSGPYRLTRWNRGQSVLLQRREDYWGADLPQNRGRYNQQLLLHKVIKTDKVALEALKKGELDVLELTPEQWAREARGPEFGELDGASGQGDPPPMMRMDVQNSAPRSYRFVGWNLEHPLFGDRRVRRAMSLLFDRETIIDKFYHGLQARAVGPFAANSPYASPEVEPVGFSVEEAVRLLRAAGWEDSDGDQVLDKDGRAFRFTVMTADPEVSVKILTLTKQHMAEAGVEMNIRVMDWSSLLSLIDEYRYDAVMLGWSRVHWPDPTALWHSSSAEPGGLNLVRYKNPEVDALIEQGVRSIPEAERVRIYRRIHEIIHRDQPYTFLTEQNHNLVAYRTRFGMVQPWYAYEVGYDYWWVEQPIR